MATLFRLISVLALFAVASCSSLFFYPAKPWAQNPTRVGLGYEDVVLIHPKGLRIHGWWLPAVGKPRGTVYFLHGNAQNISTHIMSVNWLPDAGFNVFLLDYRGYGLSEGKAKFPDVLSDIQLGLDWLGKSARLDGKPLIIFGQSLGASLSIDVMSEEGNQGKAQCAVFEAAFTGYRDITSDIMKRSWLLWPMRPIVVPFMPPRKWDPVENIAAIGMPKLVMHSKEDEVIPYKQGEALYDAAAAPKEFQPLLGQHIEAMRDPSVQNRVVKFFEERCDVAAREVHSPVTPPREQNPAPSLPVAPPVQESTDNRTLTF